MPKNEQKSLDKRERERKRNIEERGGWRMEEREKEKRERWREKEFEMRDISEGERVREVEKK